MDSYAILHPDTRLQTPNSSFWIPQNIKKIGLGFRVWEGARGGPEEAGIEKVDRRLQPNAKVACIFEFYDAFLRVGITNYQFLRQIIIYRPNYDRGTDRPFCPDL